MNSAHPVSIADWILRQSVELPQHKAWGVVGPTQVTWYSWRDVQNWVENAAMLLASHSIQPQDRIVSILPNSASWVVVDAACALIQAVHVPIDPRVTSETLFHILASVEPRLIFVAHDDDPIASLLADRFAHQLVTVQVEPLNETAHPGLFDPTMTLSSEWDIASKVSFFGPTDLPIETVIRSRANIVSPDSIANILFTSGTSGPPKGAMLSHRNLMTNAAAKLDAMPQFSDDVRLNVLPFSHAYARTCEVSTWAMTGGALVASKSIDQFWQDAPRVRPTLINAVPHVFEKLYESFLSGTVPSESALHEKLGNRIRMLACGGAALSEKLFNAFKKIGFPIYQGYGLTETSPVICSNRVGSVRTGTVGPAIRGVEIRIDGDQQLWVRGENVMLGYWRDPARTAERIVDGWLATGDLAIRDDDGHYRILGRRDDLIVLSTGRKISPQPLEAMLAADADFGQVVLVGNNRPFVSAIVFRKSSSSHDHPQISESKILAKAHELLRSRAPYERPKNIFLVGKPISDFPEFLTIKGSLRRDKIEMHFRDELISRSRSAESSDG